MYMFFHYLIRSVISFRCNDELSGHFCSLHESNCFDLFPQVLASLKHGVGM